MSVGRKHQSRAVYQLCYYAEVKPFAEEPAATKEKSAAIKKMATEPSQKVEPAPAEEQYSQKEIAELSMEGKNSNLQEMS